jgi:hypothetical protein
MKKPRSKSKVGSETFFERARRVDAEIRADRRRAWEKEQAEMNGKERFLYNLFGILIGFFLFVALFGPVLLFGVLF